MGDSDQSIYASRRDHPQYQRLRVGLSRGEVILLEQNYRSTQTILSAANAVITRNENRKPKNLWSDAGDGEQLIGHVADTEHDEAQFVAAEIKRLNEDGGHRYGDAAVFYRTNAQSRTFEESFIRGRCLQGGRWRSVLRAARGARLRRLPPRHRQQGRRRLAPPNPERSQAGDR